MIHKSTKFNGFIKSLHKAKFKKLSKLAPYDFLYGILRNIENIAYGFKHYIKVTFSFEIYWK